jgi:1-deoxy-D-xylulose-5-phosphate synthase
VTVEDSSRAGGAGAAIAQALRDAGIHKPLLDHGIPPRFLPQGSRAELLADINLTPQDITRRIVESIARLDSADERRVPQHR